MVLIPQYPTERDGSGAIVRRQLDLTDAERYGRLLELIGPSAKPWDQDVVDAMAQQIEETRADDWLLALGNPAMIALAAGQMALVHGRVNLLMYQSRARRYEAITYWFTEEGTSVEIHSTRPEDVEK